MESEKDNANPTILNTSQLPTRQNRQKAGNATADKTSGPFSQGIYHLSKPFLDALCLDNLDDILDDIDASDDFTVEPIDEQEIFGELRPCEIVARYRGPAISRASHLDESRSSC